MLGRIPAIHQSDLWIIHEYRFYTMEDTNTNCWDRSIYWGGQIGADRDWSYCPTDCCRCVVTCVDWLCWDGSVNIIVHHSWDDKVNIIWLYDILYLTDSKIFGRLQHPKNEVRYLENIFSDFRSVFPHQGVFVAKVIKANIMAIIEVKILGPNFSVTNTSLKIVSR